MIKKIREKKREKEFHFFFLHLTLLISGVENIKSSKNKTFVNLYAHMYPVVKNMEKKKDLELSTLLARKISLI